MPVVYAHCLPLHANKVQALGIIETWTEAFYKISEKKEIKTTTAWTPNVVEAHMGNYHLGIQGFCLEQGSQTTPINISAKYTATTST